MPLVLLQHATLPSRHSEFPALVVDLQAALSAKQQQWLHVHPLRQDLRVNPYAISARTQTILAEHDDGRELPLDILAEAEQLQDEGTVGHLAEVANTAALLGASGVVFIQSQRHPTSTVPLSKPLEQHRCRIYQTTLSSYSLTVGLPTSMVLWTTWSLSLWPLAPEAKQEVSSVSLLRSDKLHCRNTTTSVFRHTTC